MGGQITPKRVEVTLDMAAILFFKKKEEEYGEEADNG